MAPVYRNLTFIHDAYQVHSSIKALGSTFLENEHSKHLLYVEPHRIDSVLVTHAPYVNQNLYANSWSIFEVDFTSVDNTPH